VAPELHQQLNPIFSTAALDRVRNCFQSGSVVLFGGVVTFAIGALCFVAFLTKVRPASSS
jgi:hypothetical protein